MELSSSQASDQKILVNPKESPQILKVSRKFGKIVCPSRMLVCGPSLSGKSTFLKNLVVYRKEVYDVSFQRIIYCSPNAFNGAQDEYIQTLKTTFPDLEVLSELPVVEELNIRSDETHKLLLIDDFMISFNRSNSAFKLLTIQSHHMNISIVVTSHNLFAASKFQKTLTRNYSEIVLLYNRSDKLSLRTLGVQMFPDNHRALMKAMTWVEKHLHNQLKYILLDVSPITHLPASMIIRTSIFPNNGVLSPIFFISGSSD